MMVQLGCHVNVIWSCVSSSFSLSIYIPHPCSPPFAPSSSPCVWSCLCAFGPMRCEPIHPNGKRHIGFVKKDKVVAVANLIIYPFSVDGFDYYYYYSIRRWYACRNTYQKYVPSYILIWHNRNKFRFIRGTVIAYTHTQPTHPCRMVGGWPANEPTSVFDFRELLVGPHTEQALRTDAHTRQWWFCSHWRVVVDSLSTAILPWVCIMADQ